MVRLAFAQEVEQPPDPSGSAGATPQPENARASWPRIGRCFPPKQRKLGDRGPKLPAEKAEASSPEKGRLLDEKGRSLEKGRSPADERAKPSPPGQADGSGKKAADHSGEAERKRRRPAVIAIACVIAVFLVGGGAYYWYSGRNIESTDDAYTDGRAITIAPQVSGTVVSLDVT